MGLISSQTDGPLCLPLCGARHFPPFASVRLLSAQISISSGS